MGQSLIQAPESSTRTSGLYHCIPRFSTPWQALTGGEVKEVTDRSVPVVLSLLISDDPPKVEERVDHKKIDSRSQLHT